MKIGNVVIQTVQELIDSEMPPVRWVMDGIIPQGVTLLAGDEKSGKSFLLMQLALRASMGKPFCKNGPMTKKSKVLYFLLDDPKHRLYYRIHEWLTLLDELNETPHLNEIYYTCTWFDQNPIEQLTQAIDLLQIDLIIIDVLANIWPENRGKKNVYQFDYSQIDLFKKISYEKQVDIIFAHHFNKEGSVSGSKAMTGAVDTFILLDRKESNQAILKVRGGDVRDQAIPMRFSDDKVWVFELNEMKLSKEEEKILIYAETVDSFSAKDYCDCHHIEYKSTHRKLFCSLFEKKLLNKVFRNGKHAKGLYCKKDGDKIE